MSILALPSALAVFLALQLPAPGGSQGPSVAPEPPGIPTFLFEPNAGRAPAHFDHLLRLPQGWAALGSDRLELSTRSRAVAPRRSESDASVEARVGADAIWQRLSIELVGARGGVEAEPEGRLGTWSRYGGRAAGDRIVGATAAERLRYAEVWPGIDVIYHSGQAGLRYDFCLTPGADPRDIRLRIEDVQQASIAEDGRLRLDTGIGALEQSAPRLFQVTPAGEREVLGGFAILGHRAGLLEVGFEVGAHDPTQALVIDPYFSLFGHFGGSAFDSADAAVSDGQGSWFVAGTTRSNDFPYFEFGPGQPINDDVFLIRFNGGGLVSDSLVLTGNGLDAPCGLAHRQGRVALMVDSVSTDLPIEGRTYQAQNLGERDAYVAVFEAESLALEWSSYLGGSGYDRGLAVDFASNGDVLVAGETLSADFPAVGPIDNGLTGLDAFVARFLADGSDLVWAGSYGSLAEDSARAVAGAADGATWLAGQAEVNDNTQAFVVRLAPDGQLGTPFYFGGSDIEYATDLLLDGAGGFWLLGETTSNDMDLVQALSIGLEGSRDAFLLHRTAAGTLDFSTYLGGVNDEDAIALAPGVPAISGAAVHVLLGTGSGDLPVDKAMSVLSLPDPFSTRDAYVMGVGPAPDFELIYGSYLPCKDREFPRELCNDIGDRLLVVGSVIGVGGHADVPATEPELPASFNGASAAFLCWINHEETAVPGQVRFGAIEDVLVMGEALRFFAYRIGGNAGATSVPWMVYDLATNTFVDGLGGTLEFPDGRQVAEGSLMVPANSYSEGSVLYLVLQEPTGPVELDGNYSTKELELLDGEGGEGGGGGGGGGGEGGSDESDSFCFLVRLGGTGPGQPGLERLRWVRDQVLVRWEGGREFTRAYYAESGMLLRWLEPRPLLSLVLSVLTRALLWLIGNGEWVLLCGGLAHLTRVHARRFLTAGLLLAGRGFRTQSALS